tara:strand:- start:650 stop:994 length:345 start_codon:yes stop_codon:yes gene_type:complete
MSSNIKTAMVDGGGTGSGILVDITTSVTLNSTNTNDTNTRIYAIYADVAGVYQISGQKQINVLGGVSSNSPGIAVKFKAVAGADIYLGDYGPSVHGVIEVSAPSSVAVITVFYG